MRPMRSGHIDHFFAFREHSVLFSSSSRTSAAYRRKNELLSPRERRKGVISAPLGELRAATLLSVCALTALPSHQQHHISSKCREGEHAAGRARRSAAAGLAEEIGGGCGMVGGSEAGRGVGIINSPAR